MTDLPEPPADLPLHLRNAYRTGAKDKIAGAPQFCPFPPHRTDLKQVYDRGYQETPAPRDERAEEARVLDVAAANWDGTPYTLALEIKRFLETVVDAGTSIDSGTGLLLPWGVSEPIEGHAEADLYPKINGVEFYITIRKSTNQLLKEGVPREQLGLPDEPPPGAPGIGTEPTREG